MTADNQLKAYIDRVLRLKEEQDALGDDIREIYAEAKAEGYDKTIMGKVVAHLRAELKKGAVAIAEAESIFDTYLHAYQRASGTPVATHTHEENVDRETGEVFDTNPRLIKQVVDGMQTEAGRAALITAIDIMIEQEEAEEQNAPERPSNNDEPSPEVGPQAEASPAGTGTGMLADREGRHDGEAASVDLPTNPEIDPNEDRSEGHSLGGEKNSVGANVGGDHVAAQSSAATHLAGASFKVPPAKPLRPHCLRPENCGGYGSNHCFSCKKAAKTEEVAA
ncbi:hypothetical protein A6U87_14900 [Rhizobium sp. AC44/96]|uniref:DUF2312 domain-containing protein n=1 Tax=Rhizobium sp. AC44/96 TaxID=1841654 RepID=UPI00080FDFC3|nr:DUF2312 domain-containing protein [Rhizobium sp. AC44/96]OCJ05290.1 hypothetical protein A6U87_14900 [Rhizobium sp. AC44/96]